MLVQARTACPSTIHQSTTVLPKLALDLLSRGLSALLALVGSLSPITRVRVVDDSMRPWLGPGDRLLVLRWPLRPRLGDVVVVRDPQRDGRWIVKRVAALEGQPWNGGAASVPRGCLAVVGDNAAVSRDSRVFGPVPRSLVVGRAVWCYLPVHRRGAVRRRPPPG